MVMHRTREVRVACAESAVSPAKSQPYSAAVLRCFRPSRWACRHSPLSVVERSAQSTTIPLAAPSPSAAARFAFGVRHWASRRSRVSISDRCARRCRFQRRGAANREGGAPECRRPDYQLRNRSENSARRSSAFGSADFRRGFFSA